MEYREREEGRAGTDLGVFFLITFFFNHYGLLRTAHSASRTVHLAPSTVPWHPLRSVA